MGEMDPFIFFGIFVKIFDFQLEIKDLNVKTFSVIQSYE